jgi:septal ring factor EnvC (AmiA/AmiB activator)
MSSSSPTHLESNKPEAIRCIEIAQTWIQQNDYIKAQKFLIKSIHLYPTQEAINGLKAVQDTMKNVEERMKQQQQKQQQAREQQAREQAQQQARQRQNTTSNTSSSSASSNSSSSANSSAKKTDGGAGKYLLIY